MKAQFLARESYKFNGFEHPVSKNNKEDLEYIGIIASEPKVKEKATKWLRHIELEEGRQEKLTFEKLLVHGQELVSEAIKKYGSLSDSLPESANVVNPIEEYQKEIKRLKDLIELREHDIAEYSAELQKANDENTSLHDEISEMRRLRDFSGP